MTTPAEMPASTMPTDVPMTIDDPCKKTHLHITIGVLITILILLIVFIIYQQSKSK